MADEKPNDGGSAFPGVVERPVGGVPGMSLRDWFAGLYLQGRSAREDGIEYYDGCAVDAYAMADAMLAERQQK